MPRQYSSIALALVFCTAGGVAPPITVPFELVNRHIVLGVTVNGSPPLPFVLDTGDKVAIVDLDRARQLGLTMGREAHVGGIGADQLAGFFLDGASFGVPALQSFTQPVVLAIPLSRLAAWLGHDFDGILGADFIQRFVVEIDYAKTVLTLHDPSTFVYQGRGESIPIHLNASSHPQIDAIVAPIGGAPIKGTFVVDIGSGGVLSLHSPFVAAHGLPGPDVKTIKAMGLAGAGGEGTGRFGRVAALTIGRFSLARPMALFSEDASGSFANKDIDGNIGYEVLRRFRIFLDYAHTRMILEPVEGFERPFDRPSSGFTFETAPRDYHQFTVTGVLDASPASEAGLKVGDVISSFDGRRAADLTLTSILDLLEQPVTRTMTVRRGADVVTLRLTPRVLVD
jgi:PDZ domain/Aspartyl protease